MLKQILIAYDGSEQALKAFAYALELARSCPALKPEISVIAVAQPPEPPDLFDDVMDRATQHFQEQFTELNLARASGLEIATRSFPPGHP